MYCGSINNKNHFLKQLFCSFLCFRLLGPVWYVCLKTKNCCLKIFIKIRVGEKVC